MSSWVAIFVGYILGASGPLVWIWSDILRMRREIARLRLASEERERVLDGLLAELGR